MTDLQSLLNPEQYEAATAGDGPLLILAAAGTGKTRTLVYRVVHLIERGFRANEILLLTFTNQAAREMLERAAIATAGLAQELWGGTFHSVANRILRSNSYLLGYPNSFSILDEADQEKILKRIYKEKLLTSKEFLKPSRLLSLYSAARNRRADPSEYFQRTAQELNISCGQMTAVMEAYEAEKDKLKAMDFDDLLLRVLDLFHLHPEVLARYQEQFRHVLVDEFQDTNVLQAEFISCLVKTHRNLTVVGDDFQSIYSWRGANYRNILSFPEQFPDARIVKLERNYRSRPQILELANASIVKNKNQFSKQLRPTRGGGSAPVLLCVDTLRDQGSQVARLVRRALESGYQPGEIAVLYRSHYNALDTQMTLTREHIPFRIRSGPSFYEQAHIKDFVSLLRLCETPTDSLSFARVAELFPGVGQTASARVWKKLGERFAASDPESRETSLEAMPKKAQPEWALLCEGFERFFKDAFPANVTTLANTFLNHFYRAYMGRVFDNAADREDDIRELCNDIARQNNLRAFLENVALLTNLDRDEKRFGMASAADAITLSTIHQAKGEEWRFVIVLSLMEGAFPSARAMEEDADVEEERRLFYVAVTRAKDELYLLQPRFMMSPEGGMFPAKPSRFIRELPPGLVSTQKISSYGFSDSCDRVVSRPEFRPGAGNPYWGW